MGGSHIAIKTVFLWHLKNHYTPINIYIYIYIYNNLAKKQNKTGTQIFENDSYYKHNTHSHTIHLHTHTNMHT